MIPHPLHKLLQVQLRFVVVHRESLHIDHMLSHINRLVASQKPQGIVYVSVKDEGAFLQGEEMVSQDAREAHAHVWDTISYHREQLILEVFLEKIFLGHGLTTHEDEDLSPLKSIGFKEVFLDEMHDRLLLFNVLVELFQNEYHAGCSG